MLEDFGPRRDQLYALVDPRHLRSGAAAARPEVSGTAGKFPEVSGRKVSSVDS